MTAFKADENLPIEAAAMLRDAGFDVTTVIEQELGGHPDPDVANVCRAERRALLTLDVDFANIDAYPPSQHSGIVVFRLGRQDKRHILAVLRNLMIVTWSRAGGHAPPRRLMRPRTGRLLGDERGEGLRHQSGNGIGLHTELGQAVGERAIE